MIIKPLKKPKSKTSKHKAKKNSIRAIPMSDERNWQAQDDARTLKQSMEIKNDPARMKAAQEHAAKEMETLKMISKMKTK